MGKSAAPAVVKGPKFKGNKFAEPAPFLGAAPCGCAVWSDQAILCDACEAARDVRAAVALCERHRPTIEANELRLFGPLTAAHPCLIPGGPRNWLAFILQAADSDRFKVAVT